MSGRGREARAVMGREEGGEGEGPGEMQADHPLRRRG